jgi:hypothetical protein
MGYAKKTIEYAEYRKSLIGISHLTDPKELDKKLSGRSKYNSVTLQPLPFEGISLIHNIEGAKAQELQLSQKAEKFKSDLANANLSNKVAFVSLDSFHTTTFDLINRVEHGDMLATKKYDYTTVRDAVEKEALEFVNKIGPKLLAEAMIESIGMFAPSVVKLNLAFNKVVKDIFQAYRTKLNHHLIDNVDGYLVIRKANWVQRLSGHITIGYVVNTMNEKEIDTFLSVMCEFNNKFEVLPINLTQGEVTRFTDMDNYFVIAS